ncbi:MAG: OmpH family outer membrane protein [Bradymonadia bacterium]
MTTSFRLALRAALWMPCALIIALATTSTASADAKLAFVDMQRALQEVEDGKKAKSKLEKMKKDRQTKLDSEQKNLKKMQENLQAQAQFMKDDVRRGKEEELRKKLGEVQLLYAKLQKELAQEEAKLTQDIIIRMGAILRSIGERDNLTMILEKTDSAVLWAPSSLDLTNELIRRYNNGEGKPGKKKGKK